MSPYNFFVCGPKFTYFLSNVEEVLVDKILVRFATCRSVPEIFAIKVESFQNRAEFWTFFSLSQILGGRPSKTYTHFITPASQHVARKKFCEDTPTRAEVIGAQTLYFRPNFEFSRLNFLGRPPSQL